MLSARIGVLSSHVYKSAMPARQPLVCIRHANTHAYGWREAEQIFLRLDADPYMVLGVSESSSKTEVKSQYYRLCRELHPDTLSSGKEAPRTLGISDAEWQEMGTSDRRTALSDQFIKVSGAYQVLSNKDLRDKYSMFKRGGSGVRVPRTPNSKGQRPYDPWADERPSMYGARPQTHEEKVHERRVKWGIFGFFGVLFVVTGLQRLMQYEDQLRIYGMENLKSMRMMSDARERAMEKWREVPPESIMESGERCRQSLSWSMRLATCKARPWQRRQLAGMQAARTAMHRRRVTSFSDCGRMDRGWALLHCWTMHSCVV
ncbi:hypothetical protein GQ54DRAFT_175428 [Martensiomyces pterosporus]|nr:hypothetical protein GQ54DRAFT_175428 [Martensiomyces pterosporus]